MIPFNKPTWLGTELSAIADAIRMNGHVAGGGPFGVLCERMLEQMHQRRTLLVTSGTHALEMCALLLDLKPGDEVILPSFTFVSTANAFVLRGARPVFADCDVNGNIDPAEVSRLVGPRTRAVVAVHYAGNSCDMERLREAMPGIPLIEDAAQALGARFDGRLLGTFGAVSAISFHETKNIGCGEGGALVLGDDRLQERAEYLRDKGTNRRKFLAGMVDKYTWVDVGSSYALSDLNAAYLSEQLAQRERIQQRRSAVWAKYFKELEQPAERAGAYVVREHRRNTPNQHLFALVFASAKQRSDYIAFMRQHQIVTPFHYVALHLAPMGRRHHDGRALPMAERLSSNLVRLPLFFNITDSEVEEVIGRTQEFLRGI